MRMYSAITLALVSSTTLACAAAEFEKRDDGVVVFHGERSTSSSMTESVGRFTSDDGCVYFESSNGGRVVPVLFEGIRFGERDDPAAGRLVFDRMYRVQALNHTSPLLDSDSARTLAEVCGAPLSFTGAVLPDGSRPAPMPPPDPPGLLSDQS